MKIRITEICRRALGRRRPVTTLHPFADPVYEVAPGDRRKDRPAGTRSEDFLADSDSRWRANRLRKQQSFLKAPGNPGPDRRPGSNPEKS